MSESQFDFHVLSDVTGDDPEFTRDLLGEYLQGAADLLDKHRAHVASGDLQELQRVAHSLKGSSLTIGAMRLGTLAKEAEQAARGADLARTTALVDDAVREFAALRALLEQHIQRLAA
jgi:HPt (histidine-containing phosphotransfer) domain-containing protein